MATTSSEAQLARQNEDLLKRQVDAWARNDIDALLSLYHDDMVYIDMPFSDRPVRGKVHFREYIQGYNAQFVSGTVQVEYENIVASSTSVVGELRVTARYVGEGAPKGGVVIAWWVVLIDTIVDGKVTSEHAHFDSVAFAKAVEQATTGA
ncbi:MAG: nuclear transport factor 2 family protein [Proteobacteria bacterium]|nr:nuclear transport factor 2 family protein [Pseudomonadota bacterium]